MESLDLKKSISCRNFVWNNRLSVVKVILNLRQREKAFKYKDLVITM